MYEIFKKLISEKYNILEVGEVFNKTIVFKYNYFTIKFEINEELSLITCMIKKGIEHCEGSYNLNVLNEMFKKDINKIDFILFRTLEQFYTNKCKELLEGE